MVFPIVAAAAPFMSAVAPFFSGNMGSSSTGKKPPAPAPVPALASHPRDPNFPAYPALPGSVASSASITPLSKSAPPTPIQADPVPVDVNDYDKSGLAYLFYDTDNDDNKPNDIGFDIKNLSDYGKNNIPLKVYVSALIRTWETALLIYLPFLYNDQDIEYSQTLILEVSPFLIEEGIAISDLPGKLEDNLNQFLNFIKLFTEIIYKFPKKTADKIGHILDSFPKNFSIVLLVGESRIYFNIKSDTKNITYFFSENLNIPPLNQFSINMEPNTERWIEEDLVKDIQKQNSQNETLYSYDSYAMDPTKTDILGLNRIPYSNIPVKYLFDFDSISSKSNKPSILSFLKWVIEVRHHHKNDPILFVSHSGTMQGFLKVLLHACYNSSHNSDQVGDDPTYTPNIPNQKFIDTCMEAIKTNTWSIRLTYLGYNVTGFRHALSCDNIEQILGEIGKVGPSKLTELLPRLKFLDDIPNFADIVSKAKSKIKRFNKLSDESISYSLYSNLSLWGIFSTLIFSNTNKEIISNFKDITENKNVFSVLRGMKKPDIKKEDKENYKKITCGDLSERFSVTDSKGDDPLCKKITSQANIVSDYQLTPFEKLNFDLYSLSNIFLIHFSHYTAIKGSYDIVINFIGTIKFVNLTEEIRKRQIRISINTSGSPEKIDLTIKYANTNGLVIKKINVKDWSFNTQDYTPTTPLTISETEKTDLLDEFQRAVYFLTGLDNYNYITNDNTYYIAYDSVILYANLLMRKLNDIYDLSNRYNSSLTTKPIIATTSLLPRFESVYGGKKNKKHNTNNNKKHKKNKKHNNPKK